MVGVEVRQGDGHEHAFMTNIGVRWNGVVIKISVNV
jgi:hypothetical protein